MAWWGSMKASGPTGTPTPTPSFTASVSSSFTVSGTGGLDEDDETPLHIYFLALVVKLGGEFHITIEEFLAAQEMRATYEVESNEEGITVRVKKNP